MLTFNNLCIVLFILPVYQLLFYTVQLVTLNRKENPTQIPLGFLMLLMLIYSTINVLTYFEYTDLYNYFHFIKIPVLLAIIPTYCKYLHLISNVSPKVVKKHFTVCYLPSILIFLLILAAFFTSSSVYRGVFLSMDFDLERENVFYNIIFVLGNFILVAIQMSFATLQYKRLRAEIVDKQKEQGAFLPYFEISWSDLIFLSIIGFVFINALMNYIAPQYNGVAAVLFNIGIFFFGGIAGFYSLKQNRLYKDVAALEMKIRSDIDKTEREGEGHGFNKGFFVADEEIKIIITDMEQFFINDKPYLNSKLREIDVARQLNVSKKKLTYVLNHKMNLQFYGLINKYRIEEAKRLFRLPEFQKYNIVVISKMVGFNSKSSFNSCFKKITGVTPSVYRKEFSDG
jgi:AraC-like DNA-binding protein